MIKSKKLSKIKTLRHGFFNKTGGKSKKIYKSLNCGPGSKDKPSNIKKNLQIVKKKLKVLLKIFFYCTKYTVTSLFILMKKVNLNQDQKLMR